MEREGDKCQTSCWNDSRSLFLLFYALIDMSNHQSLLCLNLPFGSAVNVAFIACGRFSSQVVR